MHYVFLFLALLLLCAALLRTFLCAERDEKTIRISATGVFCLIIFFVGKLLAK